MNVKVINASPTYDLTGLTQEEVALLMFLTGKTSGGGKGAKIGFKIYDKLHDATRSNRVIADLNSEFAKTVDFQTFNNIRFKED